MIGVNNLFRDVFALFAQIRQLITLPVSTFVFCLFSYFYFLREAQKTELNSVNERALNFIVRVLLTYDIV